jgi:hypothetical protein
MGVVLGRAGPCGTARGRFADDRMARGTAHDRSARSSGGFSAGAGRGRGGALLGNNPGQCPAHLARAERAGRVLPGQPLRLSPRAGQPDLIVDGGDHIRPAFHLREGAHARRGPQEVLLVEAVAVLDAEAPRVQARHLGERGQGPAAEPPEPQLARAARRVGGRRTREADRRDRDVRGTPCGASRPSSAP